MSIIYEALKKVEGQKKSLLLEDVSKDLISSVKNIEGAESTDNTDKIEKIKKIVTKGKKIFSLLIILLLVAVVISILPFILSFQKKGLVAVVVEKKEIDPARVYKISEVTGQAIEGVALKENLIQEYVLEGIVYDADAPFALINGKVISELDNLGNFRINKISKDKVEMINTQDNNMVTLSLFD